MQDEASPAVDAWSALNRRYLDTALERLRLLLHRKILWLRSLWDEDPLDGYQGMVVSDTRADRALSSRRDGEEAAFYRENETARAITRELDEVRETLARQTRQMQEGGLVPALELLGQMFGLTSFERDVLLLCLAPEIDGSFQKLYAYVQDDPSKKYATPQLAVTLFTAAAPERNGDRSPMREEVWNSFLSQRTLRRFRLVRLGGDRASQAVQAARPLYLDERVAGYLRGENRMDRKVSNVLRHVSPAPVSPVHEDLIRRLEPALMSSLRQGVRPALHLKGAQGAGKRAVARALSRALDLDIRRLDLQQLPPSAFERREMLRLLEREAILLQLAYYVEGDAVTADDESTHKKLHDLIQNLDAMLFIGGGSVEGTQRKMYDIHIPKPDASAQKKLWTEALGDAGCPLNGRLGEIAHQFDFGPARIMRAVTSVRRRAELNGSGGEIGADDLWQACRDEARGKIDELARKITPGYTWDDIVLPGDTFHQLQEIGAQVTRRARVYDEWGFDDHLSRGLGISVLFAGPSGTGKTMAAEILAGDLDLDLYRIDLARMVSKYIGETEKNLKKVFDAAERSGAILFFDEADALFGTRTEVSDSHDRYANIEIDYLLQRMEEYRGLAVLASNRKGDMDRAFLRRLRCIVDFPRPSARLRRRIWEKAFPPNAPLGRLDYAFLSRLEITGANIQNVALNAAFLAAEDDNAVEMTHVMHAARREYEKIGKLVTESEFGAYYE